MEAWTSSTKNVPTKILYLEKKSFIQVLKNLYKTVSGNELSDKHGVNSLKHSLQILQNLEFTYAKFLYCVHRNFDGVNQPLVSHHPQYCGLNLMLAAILWANYDQKCFFVIRRITKPSFENPCLYILSDSYYYI